MTKIALIHTVASLPAAFNPLVERMLPGWSSFNIVDESLLQNTVRDGVLSHRTMQQLARHVFRVTDDGVEAIVVTCSTLGGAVDAIRPLSAAPLFRIDQGMAEEAVARASRIGVLATLPTTLEPTGELIRRVGAAAARSTTVVETLCAGAFERLAAGDAAAHDAMVAEGFQSLAARSDLIVLAQASMAGSLRSMEPTAVPFLTSPELGIAHVARHLAQAAA